jgi:D-serine deaminase-like pyridoxal phosphate-dependent protein
MPADVGASGAPQPPAAGAARRALAGDRIDLRYKGFAPGIDGLPVADLVAQAPRLTEAGFTFPLLTMQQAAIEHNVAALAGYCRDHGVRLAPHGKSTMSPGLHARQLEAGAWALTAATVHQAAVYRSFGVPRILLANELADPEAVRWVARELADDPGFGFLCLADSVAGVRLLADAARGICADGRIEVMVEIGYPGGRAGCRTIEGALAVARAVGAAAPLSLAGVAGYEGLLGHDYTPQTAGAVTGYVRFLREAAAALLAAGLREPGGEFLVSCGGSAFFDLVTAGLTAAWPGREEVTVVLRCGSYVTHDDGMYEHSSPFARDASLGGPLRPALHIWAHVLSLPDPGRAIAGAGRRDLPYDTGLPRPKLVWRRGAPEPAPLAGTTTVKLNDHHAYLDTAAGEPLAVGDLIGFGISHPCSAFDRWRLIPVLDEQWRLAGVEHTFF